MTETAETEVPSKVDSTLTLNDVVVMYSVIQACAARGAIKAEEMSITGALHDKIKMFLEDNGAIPKQPPMQAPQAQPQPQEAV